MRVSTKHKIHNPLLLILEVCDLTSLRLLLMMFMVLGIYNANAQSPILDAISSDMSTSGSSITLSHTTGTDDNRLMLVGVTTLNRDVTSVTYGGNSLTFVGSRSNNTSSRGRLFIYRLIAPPSGTANVVVNFNNSISSGATVGVVTYSGVNQSNPLNTFTSGQGSSSNPTLNNIPSGENQIVFSILSSRDRNITDVGSGQTFLWNLATGSSNGYNRGAASSKDSDGATVVFPIQLLQEENMLLQEFL